MGAAVLLGCPRQIRPAGHRCSPAPDQCSTNLNLGSEHLVLQVAVRDARGPHQLGYPQCFGNVPGQRLLAGNAQQRGGATAYPVANFFHVLDSGVVGAAEPYCLNGRIRYQVADGIVRTGWTYIESSCQIRRVTSVLPAGTPDTEDIGITDAGKRLEVEAGVKATTDNPDSQPYVRHSVRTDPHSARRAS